MTLGRSGLVIIGLIVVLAGTASLPTQAATIARCDTASDAATANQARQLIDELREELAEVEDQIRTHPYLTDLEHGRVSQDNLKALAGEQYNIIRSDLRSNALMVARFGATPTGEFFRGFLEGEVLALGLLLDFARALGLDEDALKAYEPRPGAQTYPSFVTSLALYGSEAEIAAAFLVNFPVFGENTGRISAALQQHYGLTPKDTAFFDFFATPIPNFECNALSVIATGLEHGAEPRMIKRAARLLQAYEKLFWDTVGEGSLPKRGK
jgi:thiaminase